MSVVHSSEDWTLQAKCRGMADALFPEGKDQKRARVVCMSCPVREACLAEALDNRIEWGVWGGLTERERRQLLRLRPDVGSWAELLAADELPAGLPAVVGEVLRGLGDDASSASGRTGSSGAMAARAVSARRRESGLRIAGRP